MYIIQPYTYQQAERKSVFVVPSNNPNKKIDVYSENGNFLCSAGDIHYLDYPTYLEMEKNGVAPVGLAEERRKLYRIRHSKELKRFGTPSWASWNLLW
jgi:hypothetical protein